MSVRKTSFSARRWAATAAAAVSALTLSQRPSFVWASEGITGTTPPAQRASISSASTLRHLADAAQVDGPAFGSGQRQPFAEETLQRPGRIAGRRPAAEQADLLDEAVGFLGQDADDDVQRGVVGEAAALDLARLQAGRGHGPVDGLAAAVDEDGTQADRLHEDHVLERGFEGGGVFHRAAAQLDDRQLIAEHADVAAGLDEGFGLANGVVHRRRSTRGRPRHGRACGGKIKEYARGVGWERQGEAKEGHPRRGHEQLCPVKFAVVA